MSEMQAAKVVMILGPDDLNEGTKAEQVAKLKARGHVFEDEYDENDGYTQTAMQIDGKWWELKVKDLDAYGFTDVTEHAPGVLEVTALWYNGGAHITEVLEAAVKKTI
jgi:hypothetical protein